jgi:hypothetical protein
MVSDFSKLRGNYSQFRQSNETLRRENENPQQVGSGKGPPALGEGQRRLRAEQARKNASPLFHAAPLADTPTKPPRVKPDTRLREGLPSSEVTAVANAATRTNTTPKDMASSTKTNGLQSPPLLSLQSGYSRLTT